MSTPAAPNLGSWVALGSVVAVGLALPALRGVLGYLGWGGDTQLKQLVTYELALGCLGLSVAWLVCALLPGASPRPFSLGALSARVTPVRLLGLGIQEGATWRGEIVSLTFVITGVTTTFVYFASRAQFSFRQAFALAPWILLLAALNAAGEEWIYRVALLRAMDGWLGIHGASVVSGVVFGLAHYAGMPGGVSGVLAAGVLGLVLSRATLETGGIATAWGVHFVQDVVIFGGMLGSARDAPMLGS